MIAYLSEEDPVLWEKVKEHVINMPDDWEGERPVYCNKCGKTAVQNMNLTWICPELYEIPSKYFHVG